MNQQQSIEQILSRMSLEQKIGQCVVVGMSGTVITNALREAITRYHCGGIRLSPFTRMFRYFTDSKAKQQELGEDFVPSLQKIADKGIPPYCTPESYAKMLNQLREMAADRDPSIPLHMVIDQENDTSKDLSRGGVVQFPSNMGLVAGGNPEMAREVARGIAAQMKASGIDMIHSPVVDVNINPQNPEIDQGGANLFARYGFDAGCGLGHRQAGKRIGHPSRLTPCRFGRREQNRPVHHAARQPVAGTQGEFPSHSLRQHDLSFSRKQCFHCLTSLLVKGQTQAKPPPHNSKLSPTAIRFLLCFF